MKRSRAMGFQTRAIIKGVEFRNPVYELLLRTGWLGRMGVGGPGSCTRVRG